jgi:hypothetical protein
MMSSSQNPSRQFAAAIQTMYGHFRSKKWTIAAWQIDKLAKLPAELVPIALIPSKTRMPW